jgi:cytochrome P450
MLNELVFGDMKRFQADPIGVVQDLTTRDNHVESLRLGHRRVYFSGHPDVFKQVLRDQPERWGKGPEVDFMRPVLGDGMVTASGRVWSRGRALLGSVFKPEPLAAGLDVAADRLLHEVAMAALEGEVVDLRYFAGRATLALVSQALFGVTLSDATLKTLPSTVACGHDLMSTRIARGYVIPELVPTRENRSMREVRAELYREARAIYAAMPDNAMKGALKEFEAEFGEQAVVEQIVTLLVSGFETSATSAAWMLYRVGQRPDLIARIRSSCDSTSLPPSKMAQDPLLAAIVKETLRLYPSSWWFARTAQQDTEVAGVRIPRGASLLLVPWSLHRRRELWDDPEAFEPDRWLRPGVPHDRWSWLPFGSGARACIGRNLAQAELAILLWLMGTAFEVETLNGPADTLQPFGGITLGTPKATSLNVRLRQRAPKPAVRPDPTDPVATHDTIAKLRAMLERSEHHAGAIRQTAEVQHFIRIALRALTDVEQRAGQPSGDYAVEVGNLVKLH